MPYYYDPGEPYDGPPPRNAKDRRGRDYRSYRDYRREDETDDAWAAAESDAELDGGVDAAGLAAGYDWRDDPQYGVDRAQSDSMPAPPSDTGPLPPGVERMRRRTQDPRQARIQRHYDRANAYPLSPSFNRDSRFGPVSDAPSRIPPQTGQRPNTGLPGRPSPSGPVPFLGVLVLVMLGMIALGAVLLACASIFFLL